MANSINPDAGALFFLGAIVLLFRVNMGLFRSIFCQTIQFLSHQQ